MKLFLFSFVLLLATFASAKKGFGSGEQEWGFAEVRPGANMFWWMYYTTAPVANVTEKPLILWLQGGPGASSTGFGNFEELGPLDVNLNERSWTWVKDANVMFVDNPVGTGFSYVNSSKLLTTTNKQIALDLVALMKDFYQRFPQFTNTPLYITCESYGGKMVAEFALELDAAIKRKEINCNFKGVGLGDSWISPLDSVMTWAPFLLNLGFVDQRGYEAIMSGADEVKSAIEEGRWEDATSWWSNTEGIIMNVAHGVDFYNVLTNINYYGKNDRTVLPGSFDEIEARAKSLSTIMNNDVKEALGLPSTLRWTQSSNSVFNALWEDFMKPVTHIVERVLNETDIKVAVFSGQLDLIVDTPGTVDWVERLNFKEKEGWLSSSRRPLVKNQIIEGFVKSYKNFGMYWVNRAGHMVPADNPAGMDVVLRELTNNYSGK